MRHGTSGRRQRNRGNNRRSSGPHRAQVFDSNGPDVRIRGTAFQVAEKYMNLARDCAASGDRILAESYLQHAEHYQRVINSFTDGMPERRPQSFEGGDTPFSEEGNEDLSLPTSILGDAPQAASKERTPETTA